VWLLLAAAGIWSCFYMIFNASETGAVILRFLYYENFVFNFSVQDYFKTNEFF